MKSIEDKILSKIMGMEEGTSLPPVILSKIFQATTLIKHFLYLPSNTKIDESQEVYTIILNTVSF